MLRATASASSRSALRRHPSPLLSLSSSSSSAKSLSTTARLPSTARRRPLLPATQHAVFASSVASPYYRRSPDCSCRRTYASSVTETETHKSHDDHHHLLATTGGKTNRTVPSKNTVRKSALAENAGSSSGAAAKGTARNHPLDQSSQASPPASVSSQRIQHHTHTPVSQPSTVAAAESSSPPSSASSNTGNAARPSDSATQASTSGPASTSPHTPSDPGGPPQPKANPTIKERIVGIYNQVKFLFRFYLNGVKQIWRDRTRVKEIKELCDRQGRLPNWSETRLMMTHRSDMKKLPLFLAILIIIEEILPLVVIYAPFLLPSTCVLPTQLDKIRKAEELKRASAIDRLRRSASVQQLLDVAGIPLKGSDGFKQVPRLDPPRAEELARRWEALDRKTIVDFSHIFALSTWLRPASVMRKNLEKHIAFLQQDDHILRGRPLDVINATKMTTTTTAATTTHAEASSGPDYSELPQSSPILMEIASERGLRASEIGEGEMFDSLRRWLILTPPFAPCTPAEAAASTGTTSAVAADERDDVDVSGFPASPAAAPSASASPDQVESRQEAQSQSSTLSNPVVQLLLLPISLYPPPSLFTPSLAPPAATQRTAGAKQDQQSTPAASSASSESGDAPAPAASSSRSRAKKLSVQPGANLVGPPDPVSNLRPVVYGSASKTIGGASSTSSSEKPAPSTPSASPHPYSTSEFGAPLAGPGEQSEQSRYLRSLLARLEVAELEHLLRCSRADRFNQDFWTDNNRRFGRALDEYQRGIPGPSTRASPESSSTEVTKSTSSSNNKKGKGEDLLSPFYAMWLTANAQRHQAYNARLWAMTKSDLGPAFRYALLKRWVSTVIWWESKVLRRGVSETSSRASRPVQAPSEGSLIDRTKEVVDQVVEVQEAVMRREEAIRKAEEDKAERERVEAEKRR